MMSSMEDIQNAVSEFGYSDSIWQNNCLLIAVAGWEEHDKVVSAIRGDSELQKGLLTTGARFMNGKRFVYAIFDV